MPLAYYQILFSTFAFILVAIVGSFLNVCIYRMPLGLSVNEPKRSFCPSCKTQIPWHQNIPLFSWVLLRGKCGKCGAPIAFRYFGVELLTAALFLAVWIHGPWSLALPYWIFVSLLIVATFIDFEHFIIPDEITKGGTVVGIICSLILPRLMDEETWWRGGMWSAIGAAIGFATLWCVVELGKKAFGQKRVVLDKPEAFQWKLLKEQEDGELTIGDEKLLWSEMFYRESDKLILECPKAVIEGLEFKDQKVVIHGTRVQAGEKEYDLEKIGELHGTVREVVIPREAMGGGDVKFIACIGAFLGWKAVFFTVVCASITGALVGVLAIAAGRREWSAKIPFGPYLAMGALVWMFWGPAIVTWYLSLVHPADGAL